MSAFEQSSLLAFDRWFVDVAPSEPDVGLQFVVSSLTAGVPTYIWTPSGGLRAAESEMDLPLMSDDTVFPARLQKSGSTSFTCAKNTLEGLG